MVFYLCLLDRRLPRFSLTSGAMSSFILYIKPTFSSRRSQSEWQTTSRRWKYKSIMLRISLSRLKISLLSSLSTSLACLQPVSNCIVKFCIQTNNRALSLQSRFQLENNIHPTRSMFPSVRQLVVGGLFQAQPKGRQTSRRRCFRPSATESHRITEVSRKRAVELGVHVITRK